jgi:hypothetical protein
MTRIPPFRQLRAILIIAESSGGRQLCPGMLMLEVLGVGLRPKKEKLFACYSNYLHGIVTR